jgi:galactose oxidase
LVTVSFQAGSLAASKIRGLIESTPPSSGSSQGGVTRQSEGAALVKKFWASAVTALVLAAGLAIVSGSWISAASHATMIGPMTMAGNPSPMLTATAEDSFTPKMAALSRTGWTVAASSQMSSHPARNAIDGKNGTFWESKSSPLPHHITINLHTTRNVSALTYLPRQDKSSTGNIGRYSISVSMNGKNWGAPVVTGTWADDKSLKTAVFSTVSARYVRLTALTNAGGGGAYTSAAAIGLLGGEPPIGPALSRIGWTASADSKASATYAASNVLDGDAITMWRTASTPLPHSITIDMQSTQVVSGLSYMPRQDKTLNGTIGKYAIYVSSDGTNWGSPVAAGKWANNNTMKDAVFPAVSARFVRLTALTEAGSGGPMTSAAEINIHGLAPTVAVGGKWSAPIGFPIVPISAVMLPNDKLLTFSAYSDTTFNKVPNTVTKVAILNLKTGKVTEPINVNTHHQMFCVGLALLADGRVLINGGSNDRATTIYNPTTNKWTRGPLMNIPRAYNADTLLSTGKVLTLGGSWYDAAGNKNGEIFTPSGTTGSWKKLPGVLATKILTQDPAGVVRADNHAWLFAQANGTVFQAGPSRQTNWITTTGNGSITFAGDRADSADAMNGNATMYDVGKILTLGGATAYQDYGSAVDTQATNRAYTIDISGGPTQPVAFAQTSDMTYARSFSNSVVLPDGKVLVVGGQQHPRTFTDTGAVLSPELWDPATGNFTVMSPEAIPRTYHAVAVLLPDGRVFSGGGGLCGGCTTNHPDGQIYSPPYLFNPNGTLRTRPVITGAPAKAVTGSVVTVTTNSPTPTFSLIRMSGDTHSVNNDQRRIPLTPTTVNGTTYTLQLPSDKGVLLPGNYMLFALDANGTPSVAKIISIPS